MKSQHALTATLVSTIAIAGASAQETDALTSGIAQLKSELAALRAQEGDTWLSEERAAEIKSLVKDLLADSATRTNFQGSGATSGYDGGFFVASADGNFRLNAEFLVQARFTFNHQSANNTGVLPQEANSTWGFENRRTGMGFSGNVVDPSWTYSLRFIYASALDPYTPLRNATVLQDAWAAKDFGNGFSFKAGQFKSPFMAESLRDDGAQLTAERSVVDYYFSGGYTQGIAASYSGEQFRATGSYNDGPRTQNRIGGGGQVTSVSLAGRFEFKAMGSWSQFESESSRKSDEPAFVMGAAIQYYNNRGDGSANFWFPVVSSPVYSGTGGSFSTTTAAIDWTVDATYKSGGFSASAAVLGAGYGSNPHGSTPVETFESYAVVCQVGYRVSETLEGFGRWEWLDIADGAKSPSGSLSTNVNNILTFGVNLYAGENVKWTTQFGISLAEVGGGGASPNLKGAGYLGDNNTNASDQFNIISQLQLAF